MFWSVFMYNVIDGKIHSVKVKGYEIIPFNNTIMISQRRKVKKSNHVAIEFSYEQLTNLISQLAAIYENKFPDMKLEIYH
jgi:hypothetical protein